MKIGELMAILSKYDPEMRATINVAYSCNECDTAELRDILHYNSHDYEETVLYIAGDYRSGNAPGYRHLPREKWDADKLDILKKLKPGSGYCYWRNGNSDGLYLMTGGTQDHCWTENYDPRMWKELESEGKIAFSKIGYQWQCTAL